MTNTYLLLGSNEGDRLKWLKEALAELEHSCGHITSKSSLYETAAWGLKEQPDFLNLVVCLATSHSPQSLLQCIQQTEKKLGRQRMVKWGQRTLDIDILFYGDEIIENNDLTIPHPFLQERRFTLIPLQEIAPDFVHPVFKKDTTTLLRDCPDTLEARKLVSGSL